MIPSIVCIGGANIDRKLRSREALTMGSSNPAVQLEAFGGVARNVAENLARLGLPTRLITAVGDDAAGRALLAHAAEAGLSSDGSLLAPGEPTGSYTAVLDAGGQMLLALAAMPLADRLTPDFLRDCALPAEATLVLDLNLPAASIAALLARAREAGLAVIAVAVSEPKMARLPADLHGLQCLILNRGELRALLPGAADDEARLADLQRRGLRQIVVTAGGSGLLCSEAGQAAQQLPAPPVATIVDVTGAGDALAAGICASLTRLPLASACRVGLELAALTLQTTATVHPGLSPAWLAEHLEAHHP
ncbi:carbohydrate kinase family protein [Roseateles violae]|uniref:Carbohydrate kinase family protein n=1 Tax=Roseateles violae TaxID=3058042 RepID=A0ABT8DMT6_9BURK|nr:carbohydrate kinase family protein [Pelomonas sp. PFR6]MDN3919706.1 carbohydrate kinase family protein [Pelomonas sp. PFR6]